MTLNPSTAAQFYIKLRSDALSRDGSTPLLVTHADGSEGLSRPWQFTVEFVSHDLDVEAIMSRRVSLVVLHNLGESSPGRPNLVELQFNGVPLSLEHCDSGSSAGTWRAYQMLLIPEIATLSFTIRSRAFVGKTAPEIVRQVLEEHGLRETEHEYEFRLSREYRSLPHVLQYQESDLALVSRLLEHEGIFYYFSQARGDEGRDTVVFGDSVAAYPNPLPGVPSTISYRPATGAPENVDWWETPTVSSFHYRRTFGHGIVELEDFDPRTFVARVEGNSETPPNAGINRATLFEYGNLAEGEVDARRLLETRIDEIRSRAKSFGGRSNDRTFRPGKKVRLSDHYKPDYNAEYLLTEMTHAWTQELSLAPTPGAVARSYANQFVCIPAEQCFRPSRSTPRPILPLLVGRVRGPGSVPNLNSQGSYQVELPFQVGDERASQTVTMTKAEPGAGPNRQHFPLLPDSAVLVQYLHGEANSCTPIITGAAHWLGHPSPTVDENNTQYRMRMANGVEWTFDDGGGQHIRIHCPTENATLHLGAEREGVDPGASITTTASGEFLAMDRIALVCGVRDRDGLQQVYGTMTTAINEIVDGLQADVHAGNSVSPTPPRPNTEGKKKAFVGGEVVLVGATHAVGVVASGESGTCEIAANSTGVYGDSFLVLSGAAVGISADSVFQVTTSAGHLTLQSATMASIKAVQKIHLLCGPSQISLEADKLILAAPKVVVAAADFVSTVPPRVGSP